MMWMVLADKCPGVCCHLWEEGMATTFVPGNFIPGYTLSFYLHTGLPAVVRLLQIPEFYLQSSSPPVTCHALLHASSVTCQRDLDSVCKVIAKFPLPHTWSPASLSQGAAPHACCTNQAPSPHPSCFPHLQSQSLPACLSSPPNNMANTFYPFFVLATPTLARPSSG